MTLPTSTLAELLATDVPPEFVRALLDITPNLYRDAYAAVYQNPCFGKPEADYLLGHHRRAMFEAALRNLAAKHGLRVIMAKCEKGGCEHVRVVAGRFSLTACHVGGRGSFPRHSHSREQYSLINEHLSQGQLFPVQSTPKDAELYGIIVHTEALGRKDKLQSVCIGFPNHEFDKWIQNPTDLRDVADIQQPMYQQAEDLQAVVQNTEPEWKHHGTSRKKSKANE
jgi:hypothetical protein